ncbi:hypothetical protein [Tsukamurella strandjordii]|uniref:Uncharacterized protein n=1 Tax=Tsukamurella strandjordii TaxID=147577 RepID=A0AA90S7H8_9ACTN|nr:hypothetical protein [Tsukamurella strandjordii]MDP0397295.1 hypothetical protein [Tsukamurella strandjordii]
MEPRLPARDHGGFSPRSRRRAHIVELARSLGDELTPRIIGDAARAGVHPAQSLKQVWHGLARFGRR